MGETKPPTPPAAADGSKPLTGDEKTMAMLCHLLGIFTGFLGSLIIWLIKKDESAFVNDQGKEALNFQLTVLIGYVISCILIMVFIGMALFPLLWICNIIFCIMGAVAANRGELYRYPVKIRFIK